VMTVKALVGLALVSGTLLAPSAAVAQPPGNDAYLLSTIIGQSKTTATRPAPFQTTVDTTEATTQADLFDPDPLGTATSGGGAEPTSCFGVQYGKTVWYDLQPSIPGAVEMTTASGFPTVIALWQYDPQTDLLIKPEVDCQASSSLTNDLAEPTELQAHRRYTVQIGGAQTASGIGGGPIDLTVTFFPDHDGDGVLDGNDDCPTLKGVQRFGGCPPEIVPIPHYSYGPGSIAKLSQFSLDRIPGGSRVLARCGGCGRTVRATAKPNASSITLGGLAGRAIGPGNKLEIWVTKAPSGTGQFKYGAIGAYIAYTIKSGVLTNRIVRCLMPGSMTPQTVCPAGRKKDVVRQRSAHSMRR
jgi:hypothetical protein